MNHRSVLTNRAIAGTALVSPSTAAAADARAAVANGRAATHPDYQAAYAAAYKAAMREWGAFYAKQDAKEAAALARTSDYAMHPGRDGKGVAG